MLLSGRKRIKCTGFQSDSKITRSTIRKYFTALFFKGLSEFITRPHFKRQKYIQEPGTVMRDFLQEK